MDLCRTTTRYRTEAEFEDRFQDEGVALDTISILTYGYHDTFDFALHHLGLLGGIHNGGISDIIEVIYEGSDFEELVKLKRHSYKNQYEPMYYEGARTVKVLNADEVGFEQKWKMIILSGKRHCVYVDFIRRPTAEMLKLKTECALEQRSALIQLMNLRYKPETAPAEHICEFQILLNEVYPGITGSEFW